MIIFKMVSNIEYEILRMCDDKTGFVELITKELDLAKAECKDILIRLKKLNLIENDSSLYYVTTQLGKQLLKGD